MTTCGPCHTTWMFVVVLAVATFLIRKGCKYDQRFRGRAVQEGGVLLTASAATARWHGARESRVPRYPGTCSVRASVAT